MEVKQRALESPKMATKADGEEKTNKDDMMIKGHIKITEGLRQAKTTRDDQSSKSLTSSSYIMKIKIGNYKNSIQRSENTKKMENHPKNKMVIMNPKQNTEENTNLDKMKKKNVWDCESTLYDSFELNSFNRQLDSAISSSARSMSMPHLSPTPPPPSETTSSLTKKQQSPTKKISRSLVKLIKSMFKQKQSNALFKTGHDDVDMDKYYVVFDKTGSLTTIPESGESAEMVGSEINSLVRKTTSERIPLSRLVGISCS
ncbi:hypothetical protein ISN45_Aa02g000480 [Arabidopsis thaliana x Arabidopsis arenosa]|uniref:Uncharacterized protein n=1 Tax=Arabidopsis thaliana x Arabidopsis arenosa TaxID=1240361 RepID=A0A8T2BBR7_9BRAS|nr:hypothetical protein ISN45_Aa02g000480 [Arabidopsis thaliana x Arabidopsis arenosa]